MERERSSAAYASDVGFGVQRCAVLGDTPVAQVNGKVRGSIDISKDAAEHVAKELALGDSNVAKFVAGKEIKKFIYVPGRIVNIVLG